MTEQVEIATPERYNVTLYFNFGNDVSRHYYSVSSEDYASMRLKRIYGTNLTFKHREGESTVDFEKVYEIRASAARSL